MPGGRFSPEFSESEHGGYNPNAVFSPILQRGVAGLTLDLNQSYEVSPALRRGSSSSGATDVDFQIQAGRSLSFGPAGATNMLDETLPGFFTGDKVWPIAGIVFYVHRRVMIAGIVFSVHRGTTSCKP